MMRDIEIVVWFVGSLVPIDFRRSSRFLIVFVDVSCFSKFDVDLLFVIKIIIMFRLWKFLLKMFFRFFA